MPVSSKGAARRPDQRRFRSVPGARRGDPPAQGKVPNNSRMAQSWPRVRYRRLTRFLSKATHRVQTGHKAAQTGAKVATVGRASWFVSLEEQTAIRELGRMSCGSLVSTARQTDLD